MTESPTSEERKRFWRRAHLNDKLASWILFAVVISLLVALCASVVRSFFCHVDVHRIEIVFAPCDSIALANGFADGSNFLIPKESLDSVVTRLELHENELNQKYQYILEKRDGEDNYRNIFMLVFGIAVSVAGFFGYRSFSNVEEKAMEIAEAKSDEVVNRVAPDKAEAKAEQVARDYCNENVANLVSAYLTQHLQEAVNSRVNELYAGEGRASIVREATDSAVRDVRGFINSEEGKNFVRTEIINGLSDEVNRLVDDLIPHIVDEVKDKLNGDNADEEGSESSREESGIGENEGQGGSGADDGGEAERGIPQF